MERKSFETFEEFSQFKENEEVASVSDFIIQRKKRNAITEKCTTTYSCSRSGVYVSKSKNKRRLKLQGSKKLQTFCPAEIKLITNATSGKCEAIYLKTHIGHDSDELNLAHVKIPISQQEDIATRIAAGVPYERIEMDIASASESIAKYDLINKQDLRNIAQKNKLTKPETSHNDVLNVEAFILEHADWVVYYKKQGILDDKYPELKEDDIIIIIMTPYQKEMLQKFGKNVIAIDGTHGMNTYGFLLHTILVVDNYREGMPTCFALTNRNDETGIVVFLKEIKELMGTMKIRTLISDMQETYFNAWLRVMDPPEFRLYCTWHVHEAWRRNLNKIPNKDLRKIFYKKLLNIAMETDEVIFKNELNLLLSDSREEYSEFIRYFQNTYSNKIQYWAYCYRMYSGVNTNMYLESFHKNLKYFFGNKEKIKYLITGLKVLKKYALTQQRYGRRKKIMGKLSFALKNIRHRHDTMEKSEKEKLVIEIRDNDSWQVSSFQTATGDNCSEMYIIVKLNSRCQDCGLVCEKCNACFHQYRCSCLDSAIKNNMCKHIHYLITTMKLTEGTTLLDDETANSSEKVEPFLTNADAGINIQPPLPKNSSIPTSELNNLRAEFEEILQKIEEHEDIKEVRATLKTLKFKMLARSRVANPKFISSIKNSDGASNNRKIGKQMRIFSGPGKQSK